MRLALALLLVAAPLGAQTTESGDAPPSAPAAAKRPQVTKIHGYTRVDDYFWLREKANPEVRKHLEAENAYTEALMKPTEALQKKLYDEMVARIKQTDETAPYRRGEWLYWSKTTEGKQYPTLLRRRVKGGDPEVMLDLNAMATGHGFFALGGVNVSDDGNLLAYSIDTTGYRQYLLQVKDLRTGATLSDRVPRVGSIVWARDNHTLFLTTEDSVTKRSDKFWKHKVGTDSTTLLYTEPDELFDVGASRSRDGAMIFLSSFAKTMTEARYIPADQPDGKLLVALKREKDHEFSIDEDEGRFYIRTNKDARNFRVVSAPIATPDEAHWKPFIAHNPAVKIEDIDFFAGTAVVSERENGLTYLRVIDKKTGASHRISTPEPVYTLSLGNNREYVADTLQIDLQLARHSAEHVRVCSREPAAHAAEAAGRVQLRSHAVRVEAHLGAGARRHARSRGSRVQEGHARWTAARPCCCTPTVRMARRSTRRSPRLASACSIADLSSRSRAFAAAGSSASPGARLAA